MVQNKEKFTFVQIFWKILENIFNKRFSLELFVWFFFFFPAERALQPTLCIVLGKLPNTFFPII